MTRRRGFTLVEMLVATAVFLMLITLVTTVSRFFSRTFSRADTRQSQLQQAESLLTSLEAELRDARSIATPSSGDRGHELAFVDANGDEVRYTLVAGRALQRAGAGQGGHTVVTNVSELFFSRFSGNVIGLELTVGGTGAEGLRFLSSFQAGNEVR